MSFSCIMCTVHWQYLVITLILLSPHLPVMFVHLQYYWLFYFNEVPGKACNCSKCHVLTKYVMSVYLKSKWSNNSPHYILQDIAHLVTKVHIFSFTPLLLVDLCIKFGCCLSLCPQSTLSHLGVQFWIFMSIPSKSHGRESSMIFVVDYSVHYEFLSQVCLITQKFMLVGL